jgi:hypothetical protein
MVLDGYVRVSQVHGRFGERFMSPVVQREQIERWAELRGAYAAGLSGLYCAIGLRGARERLAAEFNLRLPAGRVYGKKRWTDEAITAALDSLLAGRDSWPTRREFREVGLVGLHRVLTESRACGEWARQYGLDSAKGRRKRGS